MLKSCSYCGGIHEHKYVCPKKPKRDKRTTHVDKFRWSKAWQRKRKEINERDRHLCQICIRERYNTQQKYNFRNISVHHIVPIIEDYEKRLDDESLITVCSYHHEMAEDGRIGRDELFEIVREQQEKII